MCLALRARRGPHRNRRVVPRGRTAPERPDPRIGPVDRRRNVVTVVGVVRRVLDALGQPVPEREGRRLAGQMRGDACRIAEGKVEAHQHPATPVQLARDRAGQHGQAPRWRVRAYSGFLTLTPRRVIRASGPPDRVLGLARRARLRPRRPVDDDVGVEERCGLWLLGDRGGSITILTDQFGAVGLGYVWSRAGDSSGTLTEFSHLQATTYFPGE